MPLPRVAIYTRVSTEDQAKEGFSLDAQRERLRAYCVAQGWEAAREYVDDGHSGRETKRPAYRQMMAEKDLWDTILVVKMDRIHRNSRNFMEMMDSLKRGGKNFVSATESLDTSTAMGRFVMDIIQRIAQLESEQIGERVYMGMHQKAVSEGGMLGLHHPYGYQVRGGRLHVVPDEAKVVKELFRRYLAGETTARLAGSLNEKRVPTKECRRWDKKTVARILKNPLYAGYWQWDDVLRRGDHESLVDEKTFNRVQEESAGRIRVAGQRRVPLKIGVSEAEKAHA